jgi:hypothetical protein
MPLQQENATIALTSRDGVLRLPGKLPLPEKTQVTVTIACGTAGTEDGERSTWLKLSEEALATTWDNPGDDVFNELLKR